MPSKIGKKLNFLMVNFLWGDSEEKKRIHWVKWSTVCRPLNHGGLGVLDLNLTNRALLGKWVWKFANEKDSLWEKCCAVSIRSVATPCLFQRFFSPQASWILRGIANNYLKNDAEGECLRSNSKLQAGNEEGLSCRGFQVVRLNTYTTVPVDHVDQIVLEKALSAPVVAVASPSAVRTWVNLISEPDSWSNAVACIGETTASAAKRLGLRNVYFPMQPGLDGWVGSILEALRAQDSF